MVMRVSRMIRTRGRRKRPHIIVRPPLQNGAGNMLIVRDAGKYWFKPDFLSSSSLRSQALNVSFNGCDLLIGRILLDQSYQRAANQRAIGITGHFSDMRGSRQPESNRQWKVTFLRIAIDSLDEVAQMGRQLGAFASYATEGD